MRTNVVIDDDLMERVRKLGGFATKKGAIEAGLRLLLQVEGQKKLRKLKGRIQWEGDLEEMRGD